MIVYKPTWDNSIRFLGRQNRFIHKALKDVGFYFRSNELIETTRFKLILAISNYIKTGKEFNSEAHYINSLYATIKFAAMSHLAYLDADMRTSEGIVELDASRLNDISREDYLGLKGYFHDEGDSIYWNDVHTFMSVIKKLLPKEFCSVIELRLEGKNFKEIQEELDISENDMYKVKSSIRRLYGKYKRLCEAQEGTSRNDDLLVREEARAEVERKKQQESNSLNEIGIMLRYLSATRQAR
jgi:hypothetical protein